MNCRATAAEELSDKKAEVLAMLKCVKGVAFRVVVSAKPPTPHVKYNFIYR
jgi:hypothetical protein